MTPRIPLARAASSGPQAPEADAPKVAGAATSPGRARRPQMLHWTESCVCCPEAATTPPACPESQPPLAPSLPFCGQDAEAQGQRRLKPGRTTKARTCPGHTRWSAHVTHGAPKSARQRPEDRQPGAHLNTGRPPRPLQGTRGDRPAASGLGAGRFGIRSHISLTPELCPQH